MHIVNADYKSFTSLNKLFTIYNVSIKLYPLPSNIS